MTPSFQDNPGSGVAAIRGRMAPSALSRTPELFDHGLGTIVSELLQNSRRAGATAVSVTTRLDESGNRWVAFADDGCGIANLQDIVSFGRSSWSEDVKRVEDTAGMGTFSLASRGCRVTSGGRSVLLTPDVFVGRSEARVEEVLHCSGTVVEFVAGKEGDDDFGVFRILRQVSDILHCECRYAPLGVSFRGSRIERADFLEHACFTVRIQGVIVGIYDDDAWNSRRAAGDDNYSNASLVNFWGHVATGPTFSVMNGVESLRALWDVTEGARLRLLLPTRDHVVQDEAFQALMTATRAEMFRFAASRPTHMLSLPDTVLARKLGVDIRDPELHLFPWNPMEHRAPRRIDPVEVSAASIMAKGAMGEMVHGDRARRCIVVPDDLPKHAAHALLSACRRMDPIPLLVRENHALVGFPSYDALERLARIDLVARVDGGKLEFRKFHLPEPTVTCGGRPSEWADVRDLEFTSITATVLVRRPGAGGKTTRQLPPVGIHALIGCYVGENADDIVILVQEKLPAENLGNVADEIAACTWHGDTHDEVDDGPARQLHSFDEWLFAVRDEVSRLVLAGDGLMLEEAMDILVENISNIGLFGGRHPVRSIEVEIDYDDGGHLITVQGKGVVVTNEDRYD